MPSMIRRAVTAASATLLLTLTACTGTVPMEPAQDAINADCAEVMVRLPEAIDTFEIRHTDAQATSAWGSPAGILMHCGVEVPGPTTQECFTLKDVDWIRDDTDDPIFRFTTYGRDPAVSITVDSNLASGTNALVALGNAVGSIKPYTHCTSSEDVLGTTPGGEPSDETTPGSEIDPSGSSEPESGEEPSASAGPAPLE